MTAICLWLALERSRPQRSQNSPDISAEWVEGVLRPHALTRRAWLAAQMRQCWAEEKEASLCRSQEQQGQSRRAADSAETPRLPSTQTCPSAPPEAFPGQPRDTVPQACPGPPPEPPPSGTHIPFQYMLINE
ncbi:hypothetical protein AMECASPLE_021722 [Ameca splendens]|uniref:Uncharacterized protein n=1 Tax=Ameca splendens TaxID=208324 RepID=A0ABV1A0F3_9TELE